MQIHWLNTYLGCVLAEAAYILNGFSGKSILNALNVEILSRMQKQIPMQESVVRGSVLGVRDWLV